MKNNRYLFKDKELINEEDFTRFYKGEPIESIPLTLEEIEQTLKTVKSKDLNIILYLNYLKHKKKLLESFKESKNWAIITTEVVKEATPYIQEALIDLLEEEYKTKIETASKLVELIEVNVDNEVIETLDYVVLNSRLNKYGRALSYKLSIGGNYKDLLDIDLKPYRITPEQREESKVIPLTLKVDFKLYGDLTTAPSLKKVSREIKAPYSLLIDAYTIGKE